MTFDDLTTRCVYIHPRRTHEQREVVAKLRIKAVECYVNWIGGGFVVDPEQGAVGVLIEQVFFYPLDSRGQRASERPIECSMAEFAAWAARSE